MKSDDKVQLNLCVDKPTDAQFRQLATQSGFGKRPSPFLGKLLDLYTGNMQKVAKRFADLLEENPDLFMTREQLFFANELVLILQEAITSASARQSAEREGGVARDE